MPSTESDWSKAANLIFASEFTSRSPSSVIIHQPVCWRDNRDSSVFCLGYVSKEPKSSNSVKVTEVISVHPTKGETTGAQGIIHTVSKNKLYACPESYVQQVLNAIPNPSVAA